MLVLNIWVFLIFVYINILRPFNKGLKNFEMRPNFKVRQLPTLPLLRATTILRLTKKKRKGEKVKRWNAG